MLAGLPVESIIASSASTLHGIAVAKLDRGDLAQAQKAIDALSALVGQLEGEIGQRSVWRWRSFRSPTRQLPRSRSLHPVFVIHNGPRRSPRRLTL